MSAPEKILVRGVNWLGDAVMTTPALLRLRAARPDARITLLTPAKLADLWAHHPAVDAVLSFADGESVLSVARRLRAEKFELALVLPNSPRSALEVFLAGIPQRVGGARPWRNFLLTQRVASVPNAWPMRKRSVDEIRRLIQSPATPRVTAPATAHQSHQSHHYLRLAAALGANPAPLAPHLTVTDDEVSAVRRRFGFAGATPLLGLNAGAEYGPAKRWPRERFIEAASLLREKTQCHWWIFGGPADAALTADIVRALGSAATNLAGQTSLRELAAALKACAVVLTNDTGPMHLAAAVGTPVVALFGSTSPELTGPGWPGDPRQTLMKADAPCSPCFRRECPIDFRCMTGLRVESVVDATLAVLARRG